MDTTEQEVLAILQLVLAAEREHERARAAERLAFTQYMDLQRSAERLIARLPPTSPYASPYLDARTTRDLLLYRLDGKPRTWATGGPGNRAEVESQRISGHEGPRGKNGQRAGGERKGA